eukprot:19992-Lingulodinium_polyedra.AAC.1
MPHDVAAPELVDDGAPTLATTVHRAEKTNEVAKTDGVVTMGAIDARRGQFWQGRQGRLQRTL